MMRIIFWKCFVITVNLKVECIKIMSQLTKTHLTGNVQFQVNNNQNNQLTIASQLDFSEHWINLTTEKTIDWYDNCIFNEQGKVMGFKRNSIRNDSSTLPIPLDEISVNEARKVCNILEEVLKPATKQEIAVCLKKLSLHLPVTGKTEEELKYFFTDYCNDLKGYPVYLIDFACAKFRKDPESRFFPRVSQLIEIIEEITSYLLSQQDKARRILIKNKRF